MIKKKTRFEKNENQIWQKKNQIKSNHEGWNWKTISIKKRIKKIKITIKIMRIKL